MKAGYYGANAWLENNLNKNETKIIYRGSFTDAVARVIWGLLVLIVPKKMMSKIYENFFVNEDKGMNKIFRTTIRYMVDAHYYALSEERRRAINRMYFWGSSGGTAYHRVKEAAFRNDELFSAIFLKTRKPLADNLISSLGDDKGYHTLCEVGTGNGILLDYLSKRIPSISSFVGLDINKEIVSRCKLGYRNNGRLTFLNLEFLDYICTYFDEPTVFVSYDTLKYFTEKELEIALLAVKSKNLKAQFAIGEPVMNMDLEKDFTSKSMGAIAYSHNYPYMFKKQGYRIKIFEEKKDMDGIKGFDLIYITADTERS